MQIKTLNRGESQKAMDAWLEGYPQLPDVEGDYIQIRKDIQTMNEMTRKEADSLKESRKDYYVDTHLGLRLYEYFWIQPGFSMRVAENDDFWRYLSLCVVPHVVESRWGKDNSDHYWRKPVRIWLRSIWWFVHLAWQGDLETTGELLDKKHFSTDTILNFVERSGRNGICVEAYRRILYWYGTLSEKEITKYRKDKQDSRTDPFRIVMKLNTAKMMIMEPSLVSGGEDTYAKKLFEDAGINVDASESN